MCTGIALHRQSALVEQKPVIQELAEIGRAHMSRNHISAIPRKAKSQITSNSTVLDFLPLASSDNLRLGLQLSIG